MAKKCTFHQPRRNRRAIDRFKAALAPRPQGQDETSVTPALARQIAHQAKLKGLKKVPAYHTQREALAVLKEVMQAGK